MSKLNCWEFKKCGREPGGAKVGELGVCPAAVERRTHGVNDGKNGGRACWAVTGTLCGGKVQGTFAAKLMNCQQCQFFMDVKQEEGTRYVRSAEILACLSQAAKAQAPL